MSNTFLNVGPTGEGEIPGASLERLAAVGEWMKVNGESIHGTTASLFPKFSWNGRSTTRRGANGSTRLYLHVFAKPEDGKLTVKGLVNRPESASILGQAAKLEVSGKEGAWTIQIPSSATNPIATVVALTFKGTPEVREIPVGLDEKGVLKLDASDAKLQGGTIKIENDHIGFWIDANDSISWKAQLPVGNYKLTVDGALTGGVSKLELTVSNGTLPFEFPSTGSWTNYKSLDAGILKVTGETNEITLKAVSKECEGFLNLRSVTLTKQP